MIKKSLLALALTFSLSACLPYNNAYYANKPGYYPNTYNNYQAPQAQPQANRYQAPVANNFEDELDEIGYNETASVAGGYSAMNQQAAPASQPRKYPTYQEQTQNPMLNSTRGQQPAVYSPNMQPRGPQGVVGVGQSLDYHSQVQPLLQDQQEYKDKSSKLIMPSSWKIAHPSIGKGLELADQAERMNLNKALTSVNIKNPMDVTVGGKPVTVLALMNSSMANSQGMLCKNVYLLQPERSSLNKMWAKFCRNPNWSEWVLTSW
ncbi:MAG TPA: hypothetical protein DCL21_03495 [Alphaproteobacteria bacterium]|nr:hypothetical protein [Alphaproteobacteria bacterium]